MIQVPIEVFHARDYGMAIYPSNPKHRDASRKLHRGGNGEWRKLS